MFIRSRFPLLVYALKKSHLLSFCQSNNKLLNQNDLQKTIFHQKTQYDSVKVQLDVFFLAQATRVCLSQRMSFCAVFFLPLSKYSALWSCFQTLQTPKSASNIISYSMALKIQALLLQRITILQRESEWVNIKFLVIFGTFRNFC